MFYFSTLQFTYSTKSSVRMVSYSCKPVTDSFYNHECIPGGKKKEMTQENPLKR